MARHRQPIIITPFTLAGAMAPITIAGALVQQNAEALAGIVFAQCVEPGAPGGVRQLHLERRHEERRAGVRHPGIRQGDARQRPARAALPPAVSRLERHRLERAGRASGLRIRDVDLALRAGALQPRQARARLARGGLVHLLREGHSRCRDAAADRLVPRPARDRRGCARPRRDARGRARAATSFRRRTRWRATSTRSTRRCCRTGATSRPGTTTARSTPRSRANRIWKELLAAYEPPPMDPAVAEEIAAFVARRKEQGGVPEA